MVESASLQQANLAILGYGGTGWKSAYRFLLENLRNEVPSIPGQCKQLSRPGILLIRHSRWCSWCFEYWGAERTLTEADEGRSGKAKNDRDGQGSSQAQDQVRGDGLHWWELYFSLNGLVLSCIYPLRILARWCSSPEDCGYLYDGSAGPFDELPAGYKCPVCSSSKKRWLSVSTRWDSHMMLTWC